MNRAKRLEYAYAVGRVRALEKYLIPEEIFREATEAGDFRSALKLVYDAGAYPEDLIKVGDSTDLDSVLKREAGKLMHLVDEILVEKELFEAWSLEEKPDKAVAIASRTGYPFIADYLRHRIDLANTKIFFRAKYRELAADKLERLLLPGGTIPPHLFAESSALTWSEAAEKFRTTPYGDLWVKTVEDIKERETFVGLERRIEDFLMAYLRRAKYITFGPEPVFAYGLARKKEIGLIRLLGVGKMLQIPVELLKERISATYV